MSFVKFLLLSLENCFFVSSVLIDTPIFISEKAISHLNLLSYEYILTTPYETDWSAIVWKLRCAHSIVELSEVRSWLSNCFGKSILYLVEWRFFIWLLPIIDYNKTKKQTWKSQEFCRQSLAIDGMCCIINQVG